MPTITASSVSFSSTPRPGSTSQSWKDPANHGMFSAQYDLSTAMEAVGSVTFAGDRGSPAGWLIGFMQAISPIDWAIYRAPRRRAAACWCATAVWPPDQIPHVGTRSDRACTTWIVHWHNLFTFDMAKSVITNRSTGRGNFCTMGPVTPGAPTDPRFAKVFTAPHRGTCNITLNRASAKTREEKVGWAESTVPR